jgi:hypothetical protein
MNLGKHVALAAAGVSIIAGALVVGRASPRYPAPAAPIASAEKELRAELAELRRGLARTQSALLREQQQQLALTNRELERRGAEEHVAVEPADAEPEPAAPVANAQDMRDELDARFSAEDSDPRWSAPAGENARTMLGHNLPHASQLHSLECRSTLCRGEIEQPSEDAHRAYLDQFMAQPIPDWSGRLMASLVEDPPGRFSTVVFLARAGTEL